MPDRNTPPVFDRNADLAGSLLLSIVVGVALAGVRGAVVAVVLVSTVGFLARHFAKKNHGPGSAGHHLPPL